MTKRIALFHATQAAIEPIEVAFRDIWPEAETWSLLDESLAQEIDRDGALTEALSNRFIALATYAADTGVDGILFTCSAFGPAIEECQRRFTIPALKPNEALFDAAMETTGTLGLLATHPPTLPVMTEQLERQVRDAGHAIKIEPKLADGAWEALKAGDASGHDNALLATAGELSHCDTLLLAQFSMAPLADAIETAIGKPVLTSPHTAVAKMKHIVG